MALTLDNVKNYLNVTYDDEDIDTKLTGILSRADVYIRNVVAAGANDTLTEVENQLVLDACRYIFNDAFEDFARNFLTEINGARSLRLIAALPPESEG